MLEQNQANARIFFKILLHFLAEFDLPVEKRLTHSAGVVIMGEFQKKLVALLFLLSPTVQAQNMTYTVTDIIHELYQIPALAIMLKNASHNFGVKHLEEAVHKINFCAVTPGLDAQYYMGSNPRLCLRPGLNYKEALVITAHELMHVAYLKPFQTWPRNLDEFIESRLEGEGGEFQGYQMQVLVIRYLRAQGRVGQGQNMFEKYYDAQGNLVDAAGLRSLLLDQLGYRRVYEKDFLEIMRLKNLK